MQGQVLLLDMPCVLDNCPFLKRNGRRVKGREEEKEGETLIRILKNHSRVTAAYSLIKIVLRLDFLHFKD